MDRSNALWLAPLIAVFSSIPMHFTQAEDDSEFSSTQVADPAFQLTRDQWRERVRTTKLRIQEQAARRRIQDADNGPTEEAERASERVLNDDSLMKGDIVVTDKGMFVFRGRSNEEHKASDFDPVESSKLR
jgi:hypothetical protein